MRTHYGNLIRAAAFIGILPLVCAACPRHTHSIQGAKKVASKENAPAKESDDSRQITFALPGGQIVVKTKDLADIRLAVVAYLRKSDEEFRDQFIAELKDAPYEIDEDKTGRIGAWLLERRGDTLRLVRHPPARTAVMILFYAALKKTDAKWTVERFGSERVRGR